MPGDLFEFRNVGNMVPAYGSNCDATGSALEYSLHVLNVSRIIVCGHSHCGACAALLSGKAPDALEQTKNWIEQGRDVRDLVLSSVEMENLDLKTALEDQETKNQLESALERAMVVHQLRNLMTYPEVIKRTADGRLTLLGWHYSIDSGVVEQYDPDRLAFHPVKADEAPTLLSRTLSPLSSLAW